MLFLIHSMTFRNREVELARTTVLNAHSSMVRGKSSQPSSANLALCVARKKVLRSGRAPRKCLITRDAGAFHARTIEATGPRHCSITTLIVLLDLVRLVNIGFRSQPALAAENLFLRKKLALFQQRKVQSTELIIPRDGSWLRSAPNRTSQQ